jgi:hypothetical protein
MTTAEHLPLREATLTDRVVTLLDAPAELLLPERLLLYALVRGLRPERCLEIGTHFGGSTVITTAALDDVGAGTLVCVDPNPMVSPAVWQTVAHRATMLKGYSPDSLGHAAERAGGAFDFVFIDGDHTRDGVIRDVGGVLDVVTRGAHLLFHDSHYWEVAEAIDACLVLYADALVDAGTLSTSSTPPIEGADGRTARWGGFRLLRAASNSARKGADR